MGIPLSGPTKLSDWNRLSARSFGLNRLHVVNNETVRFELLSLLSALILGGCVSDRSQTELADVPVDVTWILAQPIINDSTAPNALRPADLLHVASPLLSEECRTVYYPQLKVIRIDQAPIRAHDLFKVDPKNVLTQLNNQPGIGATLRRFYDAQPTFVMREEYVRTLISHVAVPPDLAQPPAMHSVGELPNVVEPIAVQWRPRVAVIVQPNESDKRSHRIKGADTTVVEGDLPSAISTLGRLLCSTASTKASSSGGMLVQIPFGLKTDVITGALDPSKPTDADRTYKQINDRVETARPDDFATISEQLRRLALQYPEDFRFPYEHAKLVVFGTQKHDEAFVLLANSAERAIRNGQSDPMVAWLRQDANGPFRKLTSHREWNVILESLQKKDPGPVSRMHDDALIPSISNSPRSSSSQNQVKSTNAMLLSEARDATAGEDWHRAISLMEHQPLDLSQGEGVVWDSLYAASALAIARAERRLGREVSAWYRIAETRSARAIAATPAGHTNASALRLIHAEACIEGQLQCAETLIIEDLVFAGLSHDARIYKTSRALLASMPSKR